MNHQRLRRLFVLGTLGASVAFGGPPRKPYCSICNETEKVKTRRLETGSCGDAVGRYESLIQMSERDTPAIDITPHRAQLDICKADVTAEQDRSRAASFPGEVDALFTSHRPDDCLSPEGGRCMFDIQFAQMNPAKAIALIKEQAQSPVPMTARRFKQAQAELDALPAKLAPHFERLAGLAKTAVDDAQRLRKDSLLVSEQLVQRGLKATGYVLLFDPQHAATLKQKAALETLAVQLEKDREKFYDNAFHKQNIGKVLLINNLEKIASTNAADFKTAFRAGEPMSAAVYFKYPTGMLSGDIGATATVTVALEVEGKVVGKAAWYVAPGEAAHKQAWTSFVAMPSTAADTADIFTTGDLAAGLASLPEGKHQVKVWVSVLNADGSKGQEAASTTFEYDATTGQDKAKAIADALAARVLDEARMPKAAMKDAKLEKAMLANAAINDFGDVPQRLVVIDQAFTITRNWLGVILRRSIHAAVATRGKDGTCMVRQMQFVQQYEGKGYGAPVTDYPSDEFPIRCENIKK